MPSTIQTTVPGGSYRTYESFIIPHYEGSIRKTPRRSSLEKAKNFAEETATRLNGDWARAEFLSEKDRRIYALARVSARSQGLELDELCRKFASGGFGARVTVLVGLFLCMCVAGQIRVVRGTLV
jgi:hypothetical protein